VNCSVVTFPSIMLVRIPLKCRVEQIPVKILRSRNWAAFCS
jgi:hypothetical protein